MVLLAGTARQAEAVYQDSTYNVIACWYCKPGRGRVPGLHLQCHCLLVLQARQRQCTMTPPTMSLLAGTASQAEAGYQDSTYNVIACWYCKPGRVPGLHLQCHCLLVLQARQRQGTRTPPTMSLLAGTASQAEAGYQDSTYNVIACWYCKPGRGRVPGLHLQCHCLLVLQARQRQGTRATAPV